MPVQEHPRFQGTTQNKKRMQRPVERLVKLLLTPHLLGVLDAHLASSRR